MRYNVIATRRRLQYTVTTVWVLSSSIACLRLVIDEDSYWLVAISTLFFFPGITISYCYVCIFKEASRQSRAIAQQSGFPSPVNQIHNRKASLTIAIVISVFYLTALPALAFSIAELVSQKQMSCEQKKSFESWGTWALFSAFSNAAINPWVYAARKSEFKDALKVLKIWNYMCWA